MALSFFLRTIVLAGLAAIALLVIRLVISGRRNRGTRTPVLVAQHKKTARWLLGFTGTLVVSIEAIRILTHGPHPKDAFFLVHLFFAIGFSVGILLLNSRWFNGEKSKLHWLIAYLTATLSAGMIATGFLLIFRL
jgi:hypothetical protein